MIPVAFLGVSHIHTPDFVRRLKQRSAEFQVKYVYDADPRRAVVHAGEVGAAVVDRPEVVLADQSVQAVVVCSETNKHEPLVHGTAAAGKHVFVEKPLGFAASDALRMAEAIENAGVLFQTGYFRRGDQVHQFLKNEVDAGAFGTITRVRHSNCHQGALDGWFDSRPDNPAYDWRWMANPELAGCGAFGDLGTHVLDILLWIFGDVDRVTGSIRTVTGRYGECDESGEALLQFKNGIAGTLAAGWVDWTDPVQLLISGTEAHAVVINGQLHYTSRKQARYDGSQPLRRSELPAAWPHAFELFLDAVAGKPNVPLVTAREAAYRSVVMGSIYEAARTQAWVQVK